MKNALTQTGKGFVCYPSPTLRTKLVEMQRLEKARTGKTLSLSEALCQAGELHFVLDQQTGKLSGSASGRFAGDGQPTLPLAVQMGLEAQRQALSDRQLLQDERHALLEEKARLIESLVEFEHIKRVALSRGRSVKRLRLELEKAKDKNVLWGMEVKDLVMISVPVLTAALQFWHFDGEHQKLAEVQAALRNLAAQMSAEQRKQIEKALSSILGNDKA